MQEYIKEKCKKLIEKCNSFKEKNIYINKVYEYFYKISISSLSGIYCKHKKISIVAIILTTIFFVTHGIKYFFSPKPSSFAVMVVKVDPVIQKDVEVEILVSGLVQPSAIIGLQAQTNGTVLNTNFKKGQLVEKGQLLFEIEDSLQKAAYNQAIANLDKSKANLKNSELELKKHNELYDNNVISDQEYQQVLTKYEVAKAAYTEAEAGVDTAKIQLGYTKVYSPITGVAGEILLDPGNIVKAGAETLVNIHQVNPVNILFNLSEAHLPDLMKSINNLDLFKVSLVDYYMGNSNCMNDIYNYNKDSNQGKLIFVNNTVDHLNGTIALKAEFSNNSLYLWPGQFVNLNFTIKKLADVLVVPSRAVQSSQQGTYVYVAEKKKRSKKQFAKVKKTLVEIGSILKEEIVIINGLSKGQMVVTEGHGHLIDNSIVEMTYEH